MNKGHIVLLQWVVRRQGLLFPKVLSIILLMSAACGGAADIAKNEAFQEASSQSQPSALNGIVAASEILVGDTRLPFGLLDSNGALVEGAQVQAQVVRIHPNGSERFVAEAPAHFREIKGLERPHVHADGEVHQHQEVRGIYIIDQITFNEPGIWGMHLQVTSPASVDMQSADIVFEVVVQSATLQVGDTPPASLNPTARDVASLEEITTHEPPVPGFYALTVAEALEQPKPFVVVFSTPAFCLTQMCGPVADVAAQVYQSYKDQVEFIHIEPWDLETVRNEGRLVPTPVTLEWNLPTEPWTFVVGHDNRISARFEGLVTPEELGAALDAALQ